MASEYGAKAKMYHFNDYFQSFIVLLCHFWSLQACFLFFVIAWKTATRTMLQNVSFCVQQKRENHMTLEPHADRTFISDWTIPLKIQALMQKARAVKDIWRPLYSIHQKNYWEKSFKQQLRDLMAHEEHHWSDISLCERAGVCIFMPREFRWC